MKLGPGGREGHGGRLGGDPWQGGLGGGGMVVNISAGPLSVEGKVEP